MSGYSKGGLIKGPDKGDSVFAVLSKGEYRVPPETMKRYGPELLRRLNDGTLLEPEVEPRSDRVVLVAFCCTVFFLGIVIGAVGTFMIERGL